MVTQEFADVENMASEEKYPVSAGNDTGPHYFGMPAWISCAPFEKRLGMKIIKAEKGRSVLEMPFVKALAQGAGLMHGGALVSLADTAVVMAIKSILAPGTHFATISLESRFLHPVKKGIVQARASIVERKGVILKGACEIHDEAHRTVMTFSSVFKIAGDAEIKNIDFKDGSVRKKDDSPSIDRC
jgi:acyl-CoA thioesterase